MAFSDNSVRKSLIPSYLYTGRSSNLTTLDHHDKMDSSSQPSVFPSSSTKNFLVAAPKEGSGSSSGSGYKVEMYTPAFYAASAVGGILSCGPTHTAVTPLDIVKCNMQVLPYTTA